MAIYYFGQNGDTDSVPFSAENPWEIWLDDGLYVIERIWTWGGETRKIGTDKFWFLFWL